MTNSRMEYKTIRLEHQHETGPESVDEVLNKYGSDGWRLTSTQFVPKVVISPSQGDGWLYLFFERPLDVEEVASENPAPESQESAIRKQYLDDYLQRKRGDRT